MNTTAWSKVPADVRERILQAILTSAEQYLARHGIDPDGLLVGVNEGPLTACWFNGTESSKRPLAECVNEKIGGKKPCHN